MDLTHTPEQLVGNLSQRLCARAREALRSLFQGKAFGGHLTQSPILGVLILLLLCLVISGCGGGGENTASLEADNKPDYEQIVDFSKESDMPYGFKIINDAGVIQIDENYTNLALRETNIVSVGVGGLASVVTYGVQAPIMCIRSISGGPVHVQGNQALPNVTWEFKAPDGAHFQWYVFDTAVPIPGGGGYGFDVRKADGSVAFSSAWKVMKIGNILKVPDLPADPYSVGSPAVAWAPYAGTWAACLTSSRASIVNLNDYVGGFTFDAISTGPDSARVDMRVFNNISWNQQPPEVLRQAGGYILLVDVTGY